MCHPVYTVLPGGEPGCADADCLQDAAGPELLHGAAVVELEATVDIGYIRVYKIDNSDSLILIFLVTFLPFGDLTETGVCFEGMINRHISRQRNRVKLLNPPLCKNKMLLNLYRHITVLPSIIFEICVNLECRLVVVGLDAADVVRRRRVERGHQLLQRLPELKAHLRYI